jgi:DNA adenine methylase
MTDNDHVKLLNILNEHPGPVILSGYGCGLYDNRLLHRMKVARNARVESGQVKVEILWINSIAEKQIGRRLFDGLI